MPPVRLPYGERAGGRVFPLDLPMQKRFSVLLALLLLAGCTLNLREVEGPDANAIPTTWPSQSLVFAARTAEGVFVVDLGWRGADRSIRRGLARIGARP